MTGLSIDAETDAGEGAAIGVGAPVEAGDGAAWVPGGGGGLTLLLAAARCLTAN